MWVGFDSKCVKEWRSHEHEPQQRHMRMELEVSQAEPSGRQKHSGRRHERKRPRRALSSGPSCHCACCVVCFLLTIAAPRVWFANRVKTCLFVDGIRLLLHMDASFVSALDLAPECAAQHGHDAGGRQRERRSSHRAEVGRRQRSVQGRQRGAEGREARLPASTVSHTQNRRQHTHDEQPSSTRVSAEDTPLHALRP